VTTTVTLLAVAGLLLAALSALARRTGNGEGRHPAALPAVLLDAAVRLLPRRLRDDTHEEWLAILYDVVTGAGPRPVVRLLVGLRFALSCARATPGIRAAARTRRRHTLTDLLLTDLSQQAAVRLWLRGTRPWLCQLAGCAVGGRLLLGVQLLLQGVFVSIGWTGPTAAASSLVPLALVVLAPAFEPAVHHVALRRFGPRLTWFLTWQPILLALLTLGAVQTVLREPAYWLWPAAVLVAELALAALAATLPGTRLTSRAWPLPHEVTRLARPPRP